MNRRAFVGAIAAVPLAGGQRNTDWIELFDGKSLNGWRPSEHKSSWKAVDGALVADGPRSHLFYDGPVHGGDFRNFELEVELTTNPECNSGIYFHAAYQESGFPEKGFEIQINNTAKGDGGYLERKKTGSLYGIRNMYKQLVPDEKPFQVNATVRGKNVQIRLNGELLVDYVEPTPPVIPEGGEKQRFLDHGTFALQCHNDGSRASYRRVRVRPLPDDLPAYTGPPPVVDDVYRAIINIGRHNAPMVDYHVLLNSDLTLDDALRKSRRDGIQYGITADASSLKSEQDVEQWLGPLERKPVFLALSASDGKWTRMMSRESAKRFDYILADNAVSRAQAQSNSDQQAFVDGMIAQVIKRVDEEPIDIYSHATFLPANMSAAAGDLWTEARRTKLIEAFARNKVAIELDTVNKLPSQKFIEQAKAAGCKFGFGTGNRTAAELKRCEYGLQMVQACKLDWQNLYVPGSWWPKAVERRWPSA
jgi:hypothetical protein